MKKIAYVELDTHAEIVNNFMVLMDDSLVFKVDYYLSPKVLKLVEHRKDENIFISNSEILLEQLSKQTYDLVIIGTAHRYFSTFLKVSKLYSIAIIVHNLNFIKRSGFSLLKAVFQKEQMFRLKLLIFEGLLSMPKLYQSTNNLLVLGNQFSCSRKKNLPLFFSKNYQFIKNNVLRVVIPGMVSQQRRDYQAVIRKLQNFKTKIEIVFLGKACGSELLWIQEAEKILTENCSIKYFTKKVSPEKFDAYMKSADVLWCPIQKETEFFGGKEIYGKTKMSGNIGDAIRYGKPAVFPRNYETDYPFIYPEEQDIENQLIKVSKQKLDFSAYSQTEILSQLENQLYQLIG